MIFIDANKKPLWSYYDFILENDLLSSKGLIVIDNVLWKGQVLADELDKTTAAILEFNQRVMRDPRTVQVMLPVRDGLLLLMRADRQ